MSQREHNDWLTAFLFLDLWFWFLSLIIRFLRALQAQQQHHSALDGDRRSEEEQAITDMIPLCSFFLYFITHSAIMSFAPVALGRSFASRPSSPLLTMSSWCSLSALIRTQTTHSDRFRGRVCLLYPADGRWLTAPFLTGRALINRACRNLC